MVKTHHKEKKCVGVDWICLAQNRVQRTALMDKEISSTVP